MLQLVWTCHYLVPLSLTYAFFFKGNCTVNYILINVTLGQICGGVPLCAP